MFIKLSRQSLIKLLLRFLKLYNQKIFMQVKYNNRQFCYFCIMNRNVKSKKTSKLKPNNEKFAYNSPSKFVSTGCFPKQPPNISVYHLQKRRQDTKDVKSQYYIGKQNKGRCSNNTQQQLSILQTTNRLKQKRNTYNQIKKSSNFQNFHQSSQIQPNEIKTIHKIKLLPRNPITLGQMKNNKNRIRRQHENETKQFTHHDKTQDIYHFKRKADKIQPPIKYFKYITEDKVCDLICNEYLSSATSIHNSKASSTFYQHDNLNFEESSIIDKQKSGRSKKTFHKSPKVMSPATLISRIKTKKTPEQEIAEFQAKVNQINTNFQHDTLAYMQSKDLEFTSSKNINCYLGNQIHLDWKKRAVVVNWMIQMLAQIGGKRQTLANSVNILDRYLSISINIPLDRIQCIAVSSMLIASKLQDKSLSPSYLSQSTINKYTAEEIMQEQYRIFESLNFKVNTPTLNSWANRLAVQWDLYIDNTDVGGYQIILNNFNTIKFKNSDELSYYNYRWLCQYIDFSIMEINTLRYQPRMLSLAFIYIILVMRLNIKTKEQVIHNFPYQSQFLMQQSEFNEFFSNFLKFSFNQQLFDLLPMIQYCSSFVILVLKFDLPVPVNGINEQIEDENIQYQNFCSYQTKNQNTLSTFLRRNRTII